MEGTHSTPSLSAGEALGIQFKRNAEKLEWILWKGCVGVTRGLCREADFTQFGREKAVIDKWQPATTWRMVLKPRKQSSSHIYYYGY